MRKLLSCLLFLFFTFFAFASDNSIIILKDGREYKGELIEIDEDAVIFKIDNQTTKFPKKSVFKINFHKKRLYEDFKNIKEIRDKEISEIWKKSINLKSQKSNWVELFDKISYDFQEDNSVAIRIKKALKILSIEGKEESVQFFYYLRDIFKAKLIYAFSVTPDGLLHPVSESALNDEPVNGAYPAYDNLNRVKFGLKNADVGTLIIWEAEISGIYDELSYPFYIQKTLLNDYATQKRVIEITAPRDKNINYSFYRGMVDYRFTAPVISVKNGKKRLIFEENLIPEYINDESNTPADSAVYPSFHLNFNCGGYDYIASKYSEKYFFAPVDSKIDAAVKNIVGDEKEEIKKAKMIFEYINQKINLAPIPFSETKFTPSASEEVLIYLPTLNTLDKTYLFTRIVKSLGINCKMLFCKTNDSNPLINETESLKQFDKVIAVVSSHGEDYYVSFENQNFSFGDLEFDLSFTSALDVTNKNGQITNTKKSDFSDNISIQKYVCEIGEDDSLTLERDSQIEGISESYWRGKRFLSKEQTDKWVKKRASAFGNDAVILDYKFKNDLSDFDKNVLFHEKIIAKDYSVSSGDNIKLFKLPDFKFRAESVNKDVRNLPFYIGERSKTILIYDIVIPSGYQIKYIPKSKKIDSEFFTFKYESDIIKGAIRIEVETVYKEILIQKEDYGDFKGFIETISTISNEWIILEKRSSGI